MIKGFLLLCILAVNVYAITPNELSGNWTAYRKSINNKTTTIEKEYLKLNANHTFTIQLFVSVQKGEAFIKDLHIEGSGIWKSRENTLVIYIKKVEVPFAKEIYLISQESLRNLAYNFKYKYESEPLRIIKIESFTSTQLITSNEQLLETIYTHQ